jgi:NTP pyrophosphatase (non-canonical NTP hydrolase)
MMQPYRGDKKIVPYGVDEKTKMQFDAMIERAARVRKQYARLEKARYGAAWTNEELAMGFVGDVGDLVKLVMAVNRRREITNAHDKLQHELADYLWSVFVLAHAHDIDLERAFLKTMDELEERLNVNE